MSHKSRIPKSARTIDWCAVEADYRAGLPVTAIARRYRIGRSTIYRRAQKFMLERDGEANPRRPGDPGTNSAPPPRSAAADELARLRALATKLREKLERLIDSKRPRRTVLGARESPAALLLKLCQITEKIIAMERRVAGADAPTPAQLNEQDREILKRFKRLHGVG